MDHDELLFPPGQPIRLTEVATTMDGGFADDEAAQASVRADGERIRRAQDLLMAHETRGLLVLFQGMDASGKDEAIRDVLGALDPRAVEFKAFKQQNEKELRHDYLWRTWQALPARGQVGVFNRSHYEHVAGERVRPDALDEQHLPDCAREDVWAKRLRQINDVERYLVENGITVLKFFLHQSKGEQRRRLLARMEAPETRWQFSPADIKARARWDDYMEAYSEALTETNTEAAPWHVVPADREWVARAAVASVVAETLEGFHEGYPEPTEEEAEELEKGRAALLSEGD